jgi:CDP-diacylglycerol--glycerol-3-phosphate 3-phosphatidyltransferase
VFVVAILTDFIDGKIARKYGLVTDFGKLSDSIADKALTGMGFIGLSIIGELWWWVTIVILVREWGITIMRFLILKYGVMAANMGGKIKTVVQSFALIVYLMPLPDGFKPVAWVLMGVALVLTVATGIEYLWEAKKMRQKYYAEQG